MKKNLLNYQLRLINYINRYKLEKEISEYCNHPCFESSSGNDSYFKYYYRCLKCGKFFGFHEKQAEFESKINTRDYFYDVRPESPYIDYIILEEYNPNHFYNRDESDSYRDGFVISISGGKKDDNPFNPEYPDEINLKNIWNRGFNDGQEYLRRKCDEPIGGKIFEHINC